MRALREQGNEVICIAPPDERVSIIEEQGFRFVPLTHLSRKGMNLLKDFSLIRELSRIYKEEEVDLALHFTIKPNIYGAIAAASVHVKSILTLPYFCATSHISLIKQSVAPYPTSIYRRYS